MALKSADDVLRADVFEFVSDAETAKEYLCERPHCLEVTVHKIRY